MNRFRFFKGLKILALVAIAVGAAAYAVMALWNFVLPAVTGLHSITFVQALALLVLSRILFGGLRRHGRGGWHWRRRLRERWERMTPEERERFQDALGPRSTHCGFLGSRRSEEAAAKQQ